MTPHELVEELRGRRCRCGRKKQAMVTFCKRCYFALPDEMRFALYDRLGDGYEEAYSEAVEVLDRKKAEAPQAVMFS